MLRKLLFFPMVLAIGISCQAEVTVYKSRDGNLYSIVDTDSGPIWVKVRVVNLSDNLPPDDPDPDPPTEDKFGLIQTTKSLTDSINDYSDKGEDKTRLRAFITGLSTAVDTGTITKENLGVAFLQVVKLATGDNFDKWESWHQGVKAKFDSSPINTKDDAVLALRHIAKGLELSQPANLDPDRFERFLKFFIEVILPLIIAIITKGNPS